MCKSNFFWTPKLVRQADPLSGPKIHAIAIKKLVDGVSFWRVSAARFSERARLFLQSNYLKKTALARIRTRKNFVHPQAPSKILTRPAAPKRWPFFQINLIFVCRASQLAVGKTLHSMCRNSNMKQVVVEAVVVADVTTTSRQTSGANTKRSGSEC